MNRFRHRELLLTLRASTIEASFSVPMLNLTMPSFPFVIAFAAAALGWGPAGIGFMAALPHLCNMVQPLLMTWLRRRLSLYEIMMLTFIFSALPWGFVSLLPFEPGAARDSTFMAILTVATLANSLGSVSWSAAIAEVVPPRLAGRFYGRRNLVFGFWTLLVVLVISWIAGRSGNSMTVFGWIFATAGLSRMTGLFYLTRMKFPASVTRPAEKPPDFAEIGLPLRDFNYLRLVAFIGIWGLMLNLGQPFYTVFLVQGLHRPLGQVGLLTALAGVGGLLTLKGWAWLSERFGSKPVLHVCSILWALTGLAAWTFAGERLFWHLALGYLVVGATTAGFQLCQFQLMLKLSPANKAPYVAVFLALSSALTALGPVLGGMILRLTPDEMGTFLGQTIRNYHVLILGSMIGCLTSVRLLDWVREDQAHQPEAVWDSLRRTPELNPLLLLTGAAQMVLTPRTFLGLTRRSLRHVRRHVRVIGDVGEELVEGTTEVIRSKLGRDDR
jgi:MFS-type transporter involved in bile tolerance (Atg22 family)